MHIQFTGRIVSSLYAAEVDTPIREIPGGLNLSGEGFLSLLSQYAIGLSYWLVPLIVYWYIRRASRKLLEHMYEYVLSVFGRYEGRLHECCVINEALNGKDALCNSLWYWEVDEEYILKAFEYAWEADSDAGLFIK